MTTWLLTTWLGDAATALTVTMATDDDTPWILLLAGPAGAVAVYWTLYRYYRNTDKSHSFEKETIIEAQPVTGSDQKFDRVTGTSRSEVSGDNVTKHRVRVNRLH